jgi:hypothetical protein
MEIHRVEQVRSELNHLLKKQCEILKSREFGGSKRRRDPRIRDQASNHSRNVQ